MCGSTYHVRENEAREPAEGLGGGEEIAQYAFADESKRLWIYKLKDELGLFDVRGRLCGNPDTIDKRLREHERATANA